MTAITNIQGPAAPWRFLHDYQPIPSVFDEMLSEAGTLRPQCEAFVRSVEAMGPQEFASRRDNARRV